MVRWAGIAPRVQERRADLGGVPAGNIAVPGLLESLAHRDDDMPHIGARLGQVNVKTNRGIGPAEQGSIRVLEVTFPRLGGPIVAAADHSRDPLGHGLDIPGGHVVIGKAQHMVKQAVGKLMDQEAVDIRVVEVTTDRLGVNHTVIHGSSLSLMVPLARNAVHRRHPADRLYDDFRVDRDVHRAERGTPADMTGDGALYGCNLRPVRACAGRVRPGAGDIRVRRGRCAS